MLQRNFESAFVPGVHVFPGGTLDEEDESPALHAQCDGPDDAAASRVLGVARGGLAYWIAAIRELFEEAGVLLARDAGGELISLADAKQAARMRRAPQGRRERRAHLRRDRRGRRPAARGRPAHLFQPLDHAGRSGAPLRHALLLRRRARASVGGARQPRGDRARVGAARPISSSAMRRGECKLRTPTRHTLDRFRGVRTAAALIAAVQTACRRSRRSRRASRARGRSSFPANPATRKRRARKDAANGNPEPDRRRMNGDTTEDSPRRARPVERPGAARHRAQSGDDDRSRHQRLHPRARDARRHRSGARERGRTATRSRRRSARACAGYSAPTPISIIRRTREP